jgi:hypothetical protein
MGTGPTLWPNQSTSSARKLAAVFARQDFYEACLRQDAGAMVTIFEAGKVTQGQLAALTGIAQST